VEKKMKKNQLLMILIMFHISYLLFSAFILNQPMEIIQPDGTKISCFASGDEFFNYLHDEDGFTIIQADDGYYYWAIEQDGAVVASQYRVDLVNPRSVNLRPYVKISKELYEKRKNFYKEGYDSTVTRAPHTGEMNNLVVYIRFNDDSEFTIPRSSYDANFNAEANESVYHYFQEVSYQELELTSTHYPICAIDTNLSYQDLQPRNYYEPYNATTNPNGYNGDTERRTREHTLLQNAVAFIESEVPLDLAIDADNDGYVDNVSFMIRGNSGEWAELLWAHRWVLYTYDVRIHGKQVWDYTFQPENQTSVRVLCHELFHALGAPDLYRYYEEGTPVGPWDLMSSGFVHMGAWMKYKYTNHIWINSIPVISQSGTYTLNPLTSPTNNVYRINSPNSTNEFFIVEYRKTDGFYETNLPGSGLLVYRIHSSYDGNADGPPDEVYIYRPNGTTNNDGSPYSAHYGEHVSRTEINDTTNPSSFLTNGSQGGLSIGLIGDPGATISFVLNPEDGIPNPQSFTALPISTTQIGLEWTKNMENHDVMIAWSADGTFGTPADGTVYSSGSSIPGGGIILYRGAQTSYSHFNLAESTTYFYRAYSYNASIEYSAGYNQQATTFSPPVSLPFTENFSSTDQWTQQSENCSDRWAISATSNAGGISPEMRAVWESASPATTRLITPMLNTSGYSSLDLSFKHYFDYYASGVTIKIQSSSDLTNWTDEAWQQVNPPADIGPATVESTISHNLGSITYIAWTITGNLYNFDNWYIDDVEISGEHIGDPEFSMNPTSLDFGNLEVGNSQMLEFTLTNDGLSDMTGSISTPTGYSVSDVRSARSVKNVLSYLINPSASKTFYLTFSPVLEDNYDGIVAISSNDPLNPNNSLSVYGEGLAPQITWNPTEFQKTLDPNSTGSENLTIGNSGSANLNYTASVQFLLKNRETLQVYPDTENYETGSCDATQKTQTSLARAYNTEDGWLKFDISSLPSNVTINSIEFHGYVNYTNYPYWSITALHSNPLTTEGSLLHDIIDGETDGRYNYFEESSDFPTGWKVADLGGSAVTDFQSAVDASQDWFAVGINSTDNSPTYYIVFDGWNEANPPYLVVDYTVNQIPWLSLNGTSSVNGTINVGAAEDGIPVQFDTTDLELGTYQANIVLSSNDPENSEVIIPVELTVDNVSPIISLSAETLDFGTLYVDEFHYLPLTISNNGSNPLTGTIQTIEGFWVFTRNSKGDVTSANRLNSANFNIPGQSNKVFDIYFYPEDNGVFDGNIIITSNAPANPQKVLTVSGTGIYPPIVSVSTQEMNFGDVAVLEYSSLPLTVSNLSEDETLTGTVTTNIGYWVVPPAKYTERQNSENFTLTPLQTIDYNIFFYPEETGDFTTTISVTSNDPNTPETIINVTGNGILAAPTITNVYRNINNRLVITWSAVPGAEFYQVYSADTPGGTFLLDESGTFSGNSWSTPLEDGAKLNAKRFYKVIAVKE
jgi:M6 family metalloprotease-like protein